MSLAHIAVFLAACLCVALGAPVEDVITPYADEEYRLPTIIKPVNYKVQLRPYLLDADGAKQFTFDGEADIEIVPTVNTKSLVLHSKNLIYSTRQLWAKGESAITTLSNVQPNAVTDIITYELTTELLANKAYILHFVYTGTMDDDMHGFYRSSYVDSKNITKWLGSTQFETNHARRAFPSFDEPKFKATFDITLIHHKSMKSVSNTRITSSTLNGDYVTDVYATTPIMSTYILAFLVSEFNERFNGEFGVLARPEFYDQTEYAHDVGQALLKEMDDYLQLPYYTLGVDKMHMAAIPDFSAGAMENWGLLTYRERSLLYEEGSTTLSAKQSIAAVVAHEQTHMWFGDLVTCDWWSYTWLNEGFARYFQYFLTAKVETELQIDQQFVVDQVQSVMSMDSTNATNPMSDNNTNTPADLNRMFNSISYNKGASIIRMVNHVMTEEKFRLSLQEYLKQYQYQNAIPSNLFEVWKKHWPTEFATYSDAMFKSFTEQVGYPVVMVNVASDGKSFQISQSRFLIKENDNSDKSLLYTVPITYTTAQEKNFDSTSPKFFLEATTATRTINLGSTAAVGWVIANIQQTGYYRVNYDEAAWHNIHHALLETNWDGIHELNRAQIVDDLLNLARSGHITYTLALSLLEYLTTETHYSPWTSAFNGYNYLTIRLGTDTEFFGNYIRVQTKKVYDLLGFEERASDSALDIYTRTKILSWNCRYGNEECVSHAKTYFDRMDTTPVPVNIRGVVYCAVMRDGDENNYNKLYNKFRTETVATEQILILNNLGCVRSQNLIEKFFWAIVSDEVRRQDKSTALSYLYTENNENVEPVFDLVTANYVELGNSMGGLSSVATVISNIASRFTEAGQKTKLENFNRDHKAEFGSSATTLENAEKTVTENMEWANAKLGTFKTYLENYRGGSASLNAFTGLTILLTALLAMMCK